MLQQITSRQDFDAFAQFHGLPEGVTIGASFDHKGTQFVITGARPRRNAAPVEARDGKGKTGYFPIRTLKILDRLEKMNKIFV